MPVLIMVGATIARRVLDAPGSRPAARSTRPAAIREAARLCGHFAQGTIVMVFALHGFFTGVAALMFATELRVIQSTAPPNLELTIITAAVVGGVSILGGVGTVIGATLRRDPDRRNRQRAGVRQHLALLDSRGAGRRSFWPPSSPTSCAGGAARGGRFR
jgi:hypothetical protein